MNKLAHSLRRLLVPLLGILALFACQLTSTQETEQTFTFPTLKEKIVGADQLTIILKDSTDKVIDVLYSGPVDTSTSFKNLLAKNYAGGTVFIHIEAKKGGTVIYNVKRAFDAAQGGNLSQVVYISPDAAVTIARPAPRIREGETVPLPSVTVLPATLADKSLEWVSRDPRVLQVDGATLKGILPGSAMLVAVLRSDPLRRDSLTVDVDAKDAFFRVLDSLRIEPDALTLAVKGPPGRLRVRVSPTGAPDGVQWSTLAATVATVDSAGEVRAVGAGQARVVAVSKTDATVADTVLVQVLPEQKIDSVRFKKAALDLFAGGTGEPLDATVHPPLANQEVLYSLKDPALARVEGSLITGLKEGETVLIVKSAQDPTKADTVPVTVFPSEKVDSVRLALDSVNLYLGGESQLLRASIHPATLRPRFLWRSADDKVVEVDAQGKVSPKGPGKAYVSATSRADGSKRDSTLVIVRKDVPKVTVGQDTIVSAGTTVVHRITVTQDYGQVTQFKADLNGDGIYEDFSATVPASRSFLYDGVKDYAVRFYVRDTEGNETVVTRLVKAVNGRIVQITSPRDGGQVNQTPITVSWLVDGVPQSNSQALVPGEQTITREARDSAGKVYSHSIRVTLDQTAPNRPVVKGSAVPVNTLTPTWTWTSGGGGGNGTYRYRLDNPAMSEGVVTSDTFHTAATNLTAGAHTLYVDERDEAGNWSASGSAQIRIDTTAPAAPTVTVTPSGVTNNRRPAWSWTSGSEAVAQFRFKFGSDDFRGGARDTTATSHQPAVDLGEGSHTLFVQARDSAGNWSRAGSATVSIDLSGPGAPTVSVASALTNDPTPTWTWSTTTSGAVTFRYRFNNPDLSTGATVTTEKSYTHPTNLGDGTYTLYVQEGDAAGNWSLSGSRQVQVDVTPPQPPRIDSTPFSPLNTLKPRWTWGGGAGGAKVFKARVDDPNVDAVAEQSDSSFTPEGYLAEGWRTLYVKERDVAGNWSAAASRRIFLSGRGMLGNRPLEAYSAEPFIKVGARGPFAIYRNDKTFSAKTFDGQWTAAGIIPEEMGIDFIGWFEMEIDPLTGYPVLCVFTGGLKFARFNGTTWDMSIHSPIEEEQWFGGAFAGKFTLTAQGDPLTVFVENDQSGEKRAYLRRFNGLTWDEPYPSTQMPDQSIGKYSFYALRKLLLDKNQNKPYLVYEHMDVDKLIMGLNGSTWERLPAIGLPNDITYVNYTTSSGHIAINNKGQLHIAVSTESNGFKPTVYRFDGSRWNVVGSGPVSDQAFQTLLISFSSTGEPIVAAQNKVQTQVFAYIQSQWHTMAAGTSTNPGTLISMDVSKDNVPYLGFSSSADNGAPVVFKWAFDPQDR